MVLAIARKIKAGMKPRLACVEAGVHYTTYYKWKKRFGVSSVRAKSKSTEKRLRHQAPRDEDATISATCTWTKSTEEIPASKPMEEVNALTAHCQKLNLENIQLKEMVVMLVKNALFGSKS